MKANERWCVEDAVICGSEGELMADKDSVRLHALADKFYEDAHTACAAVAFYAFSSYDDYNWTAELTKGDDCLLMLRGTRCEHSKAGEIYPCILKLWLRKVALCSVTAADIVEIVQQGRNEINSIKLADNGGNNEN